MLFTHTHRSRRHSRDLSGVGGLWGIAAGRGVCMQITGKAAKAEAKRLWLRGRNSLCAGFWGVLAEAKPGQPVGGETGLQF